MSLDPTGWNGVTDQLPVWLGKIFSLLNVPIDEVADESTDEPTNELNEYRMDNEQDELQDIEPSSIITPDDWENQLRDWEQMLIDEEIARSEDENTQQ
ncbi:hypothetical protein G9A89_013735 [Geosiphon pyriformis]|nr:hypothetical protein G9A89_013735 [Geosiphon pyriformis]